MIILQINLQIMTRKNTKNNKKMNYLLIQIIKINHTKIIKQKCVKIGLFLANVNIMINVNLLMERTN